MNSTLLLRARTTATKEVLIASDGRVVANHLGVGVDRVADTMMKSIEWNSWAI